MKPDAVAFHATRRDQNGRVESEMGKKQRKGVSNGLKGSCEGTFWPEVGRGGESHWRHCGREAQKKGGFGELRGGLSKERVEIKSFPVEI